MSEDIPNALVVSANPDELRQKVTPKELDQSKTPVFVCTKVWQHATASDPEVLCRGTHFRHAGYLQHLVPFAAADGAKVAADPVQVMLCIKCKTAYSWIGGQVYDVSKHVDLQAWDRTEKDAYRATGPGGQC